MYLACFSAVEYLVQRLLVYIAQQKAQVLTQGYVSVCMNHETASDTKARQFQTSVSPFVIKSKEVKVLIGRLYRIRDSLHEVVCRQKVARSIEEGHGSVYTDADIQTVIPCHSHNIIHIVERIPWGQAEH